MHPMPALSPLRQHLGDRLWMRTPANQDDVARVAAFNGQIHGPGLAALTTALATAFPGMEPADLIFVEDEESGQVVSSLCLVPWSIKYGPASLPVGEMGLVGTLAPYRRRGLIRAQVDYFKQRLHHHGCLLSLIQGIPYYYRQFGYAYALPLEGGFRLDGHELPSAPETQFTFRRAAAEDIPTLARLYDEAAQDLVIHAVREEALWRYLLGSMQKTELSCVFWLMVDGAGQVAGYLRLPDNHFGEELAVSEVSRLSFDAALAALHQLTAWARERKLPGVRLNLPGNCTLMRLARSLGAHDLGTYAWQVHVPEMAGLLHAIAPTLEARIAASPFAGLTRRVNIGFYRAGVALHFAGGALAAVEDLGPHQGEINFPETAFIPLLLGYHTLDEVRSHYPDVNVAPAWRLLVETLFPKANGFLYPCT